MTRHLVAAFLGAALATAALAQAPASFVRPKQFGRPDDLGRNIQRTMTLLAASTPEKRNTVKILFYGQSITEQDWWKRGHIVGTLCRLQNLSVVSRSAATDGMAPYPWDSVRKET